MSVSAQKLNVESFALKPNDLTARTQPRQDSNNDDCALVKVLLASSGATYSGNVVGDVKYNTSEYWVYMAQGSKRLTIRLEGYLPLEVNFEDYGVKPLEQKTVYVMTVSGVSGGQTIEAQRVKTGWIILESKPQGASVFINDEFVGNTPLTNYKQAYGIYSYRVEHPNYHPSAGTIELNAGKLEKVIELKPAFGSIAITCNINGAIVLLDGKATNKVTPCTLEEIPSGQHTITIQKDKYSPRQQSVTVEDGQNEQLSISLDARFAQISIASLDGAQIYCNGKQIGITKHVEEMMEGYYDIEVRMAHHKPVTKQIQVIAGHAQEITLNPTPIYGSLDITSSPHDADVTIDGKLYGKTPLTIEKLLEGEHEIIISKNGYTSETHMLEITENSEAIVSAELKEMKGVIISLKEGETLQAKLDEITGPVTQLTIKGTISKEDWEVLCSFCKEAKIKILDMKGLVNITNIPEYSFRYYRDLATVVLPDGIKEIDRQAFQWCSGLTSIIIPNSVSEISFNVFEGCTSLTSITIPNNVTSIRDATFYECSGLTSITIPNGVKSIEANAFDGCSGLTSITIPNGVTIIEHHTFAFCSGLTSITIPNSVKEIEEAAFCGCTNLTSISIPNSVTSIGDRAFKNCSGLTSVTIPNSVRSIGWSAFLGCSSLTSVTIPNSVTIIEEGAFEGCI